MASQVLHLEQALTTHLQPYLYSPLFLSSHSFHDQLSILTSPLPSPNPSPSTPTTPNTPTTPATPSTLLTRLHLILQRLWDTLQQTHTVYIIAVHEFLDHQSLHRIYGLQRSAAKAQNMLEEILIRETALGRAVRNAGVLRMEEAGPFLMKTPVHGVVGEEEDMGKERAWVVGMVLAYEVGY